MNNVQSQPPARESGSTSAPISTRRPLERRRRTAPHGRRAIGAHWHRRGEWRSVVTGGVAESASRAPRRAWLSLAALAAVATVAGAAIGIGATRLGWLPATGAVPIVLAALAFAASGAFAILACCVEIDEVVGSNERSERRGTDERSRHFP